MTILRTPALRHARKLARVEGSNGGRVVPDTIGSGHQLVDRLLVAHVARDVLNARVAPRSGRRWHHVQAAYLASAALDEHLDEACADEACPARHHAYLRHRRPLLRARL
eukprot:scaffold10347_cov32-Tisochrysis_lutea.AAC.1